MAARSTSQPAIPGLPRLDRSLPLTRLPRMIAEATSTDDITVLDDLPLGRFSPATLHRVLIPATEAMVDAVVAEVDDTYASLRGGPLENHIRRAVQGAIHQFAGAVYRGRPELDRSLFRALGRRHARAGLPLSELAALFTRCGLACWRSVLELHRGGELPDELLEPSGDVVLAFAQELCSAAVEGYTEAIATAGTAVRSQRTELVRRLVERQPPDHAAALSQAHAVGWELPQTLAVAVTSADVGLAGDVTWPDEVLGAPDGARWCLLLPVRDGEIIEPAPPPGTTMAVGPVVPWDRAHGSLRLAESLAALAADESAAEDGTVLHVGDHAAELLLAEQPLLADELIHTVLGPLVELPAHRRGPLLETLAAWVRQPGHHTALAQELHVGVRTVRYRVDRLRELLGDVIDDASQRLVLGLAVLALERVEPPHVIVLDHADVPAITGD